MRLPLATCFLCLLLLPYSASAAPKLSVERPVFDFGTIVQGNLVDHVFNFKNTGDTPLRIKQVRPSCGCTAATVSSSTIQPGKKGEIKASFNSTNYYGKVRKEIIVETDDPAAPSFNLALSGTILEEIEVAPKSLDFGRMKANAQKTMEFTITNHGVKTFSITSFNSTIPQALIRIGKNSLVPGEPVTVTVTVTPRDFDRVISGHVNLNTDFPAKQNISVPFYGSPSK